MFSPCFAHSSFLPGSYAEVPNAFKLLETTEGTERPENIYFNGFVAKLGDCSVHSLRYELMDLLAFNFLLSECTVAGELGSIRYPALEGPRANVSMSM